MSCPVRVASNPEAGETITFLTAPSARVQCFRLELGPVFHGPPAHRHPAATETFGVVSGILSVRLGRRWLDLSAGEQMDIAPGTIHTYGNRSGADVVVDVRVDPGRELRGFFEDLYDLAQGGSLTSTGSLHLRQAARLFLRYPGAMTVAGPPAFLQPLLWRVLAGGAWGGRTQPGGSP